MIIDQQACEMAEWNIARADLLPPEPAAPAVLAVEAAPAASAAEAAPAAPELLLPLPAAPAPVGCWPCHHRRV